MPPKKRIELPEEVREALLDEVSLTYEVAQQATETSKIRMYLAIQQGLTTREIADQLNARSVKPVSQSTISNWSREGEQARKRRDRERAERPGEREQIG